MSKAGSTFVLGPVWDILGIRIIPKPIFFWMSDSVWSRSFTFLRLRSGLQLCFHYKKVFIFARIRGQYPICNVLNLISSQRLNIASIQYLSSWTSPTGNIPTFPAVGMSCLEYRQYAMSWASPVCLSRACTVCHSLSNAMPSYPHSHHRYPLTSRPKLFVSSSMPMPLFQFWRWRGMPESNQYPILDSWFRIHIPIISANTIVNLHAQALRVNLCAQALRINLHLQALRINLCVQALRSILHVNGIVQCWLQKVKSMPTSGQHPAFESSHIHILIIAILEHDCQFPRLSSSKYPSCSCHCPMLIAGDERYVWKQSASQLRVISSQPHTHSPIVSNINHLVSEPSFETSSIIANIISLDFQLLENESTIFQSLKFKV